MNVRSILREHGRCLTAALLPVVGGVAAWTLFILTQASGLNEFAASGGVLATLVGALGGSLVGLVSSVGKRRQAAIHFRALCDAEAFIHTGGIGPEYLPPLPSDPLWQEVSQLTKQALSGLAREIAHSQQARAAMEVRIRRAGEQARQAEQVLGALPHPVFLLDAHLRLVYANRAALDVFGWDGEALGKPMEEIIHSDELLTVLSTAWRRKSAPARTQEVELNLPDGRREAFSCRIVRFAAETSAEQTLELPRTGEATEEKHSNLCVQTEKGNGVGSGLVPAPTGKSLPHGSVGDLSLPEDKMSALTRRSESCDSAPAGMGVILEQRADLRTLRSQEAAFLSAVSHEMKTPLASIRAYAELLADTDAADSATREEFLTVINTQVERLQRLVQGLLDLARIEAGILQVNKDIYSLNEILEQAANVVRPAAEAKSLELLTDLSPLFLPVCVDRDLMLQAAINLLSNAVKYTPSGGRVILRSRLDSNDVFFQVEDTGVGLSEEECRRIFDRFYRVKRNEQMAEGTGLGLALVKSIVEDIHGGRITVESALGKGTTFTVRLASQQAIPVSQG